jgi:hypothetical protein
VQVLPVHQLMKKRRIVLSESSYRRCKYDIDKVYIDGANPSFIKSLKLQIGEEADYDKVIARYRSEKLGDSVEVLLL